jgi:hypothetical protein
MRTNVTKDATGLARHAAIGGPAWTRIARVQQPPVGRTALAGAENAGGGIGTRDRSLCPGQYQGRDRGRETEIIIMHGSQGLEQDRDPWNGAAHTLTLGPTPVLVPVLTHGPTRGRGRGRGRAIREAVSESAHGGLVLEARRRVAAAAAVGSANGEEREVERRMYVLVGLSLLLLIVFDVRLQREKRERRKNGMASAAVGGQWGKYGIITDSEYVFNPLSPPVMTSSL